MAGLEIYWFRLDGEPGPGAWACLSPDEQARAQRFAAASAQAGHAARYVAAHAQLRRLLGQRLGCAPGAVELRHGAHGKPEIAGGGLQFNLSHSGQYALVGMHPSLAVGVDIERERARNFLGLARRYFSPGEQAWLAAQPAAGLAHAFCRLWTCKEAWMKADGRGLRGLSLPEADLRGPAAGLQADGRGWFARELATAVGYAAAVVMDAPPAAAIPITARPLPPPP